MLSISNIEHLPVVGSRAHAVAQRRSAATAHSALRAAKRRESILGVGQLGEDADLVAVLVLGALRHHRRLNSLWVHELMACGEAVAGSLAEGEQEGDVDAFPCHEATSREPLCVACMLASSVFCIYSIPRRTSVEN